MWRRRNLLKAAIATSAGALPTIGYAHGGVHVGSAGLKRYAAHLINIERRKVDASPVTLGINRAAQVHAESMAELCYLSHWNIDGTKPYMRYALAGGDQFNNENIAIDHLCLDNDVVPPPITSPALELHRLTSALMKSPGHKANILDSLHRNVNIGIAWNSFRLVLVQHFEYDTIRYDQRPSISDSGIIDLDGRFTFSVSVQPSSVILIALFYDPPPKMLTLGQLAGTTSYGNGDPVALIATGPLSALRTISLELDRTIKPYNRNEERSIPKNIDEYRYSQRNAYYPNPVEVPVIAASDWTFDPLRLSVKADISDVLRDSGVYSVGILHSVNGEQPLTIGHYPIFHDITPPEGYGNVL